MAGERQTPEPEETPARMASPPPGVIDRPTLPRKRKELPPLERKKKQKKLDEEEPETTGADSQGSEDQAQPADDG